MRLGFLLLLYRANKQIGIREFAHEVGVSAATMSRIERGMPCDLSSLTKLLAWLTAAA